MKGADDPRPRLIDILDAITGVTHTVSGKDLDAYRSDWTTRRAVERGVEIISEATRHLPDSMKGAAPGVPWPEIASIGNVLRHAYHRIDDEIIYMIATRQLDSLKNAVLGMLNDLDEST